MPHSKRSAAKLDRVSGGGTGQNATQHQQKCQHFQGGLTTQLKATAAAAARAARSEMWKCDYNVTRDSHTI